MQRGDVRFATPLSGGVGCGEERVDTPTLTGGVDGCGEVRVDIVVIWDLCVVLLRYTGTLLLYVAELYKIYFHLRACDSKINIGGLTSTFYILSCLFENIIYRCAARIARIENTYLKQHTICVSNNFYMCLVSEFDSRKYFTRRNTSSVDRLYL
jgi:hypothetical protein